MPLTTLDAIVSAAVQLGAEQVPGWSPVETTLASNTLLVDADVRWLRQQIRAGADPLGDAFCAVRAAEDRRPLGQTYTPAPIIASMIDWAANEGTPARVIDPGTGSARFLRAAGQRFPRAELVGTDVDPVATLMARANLAVSGLAGRARVLLGDYRQLQPEPLAKQTLYVGNPPYVRHHQLGPVWKQWLTRTANSRGLDASQLAGLHVHFFLATAQMGSPGDYGVFITSSEWLDVNYGRLVRQLLLDGLGGQAVHVLDAAAAPFADAITTGAITCFHLGQQPTSLRLRQVRTVKDLGPLTGGRKVSRARLADAARWSPLLRTAPKLQDGYVELGELCRVHRGTVTGANNVWVVKPGEVKLPDEYLTAAVTKARELFAAGRALVDRTGLRLVVDLPTDLDELDAADRRLVDRFLKVAAGAGARDGYVARNRKAWWSVGLRTPAPLLATYMARRPPAFVRNLAGAAHINIAHGIYPREPMTEAAIRRLAEHLRVTVTTGEGRTYAGGLTKFEPREMERLPVPTLDLLSTAP